MTNIEMVDAVVVGAGFAGLYTLHRLVNDLKMNAVCIDAGEQAGGTWNWNSYPGAKSDSESYTYRYSFDKEFYAKTATWPRRYVNQTDLLSYFQEFVQHFGLSEHLVFRTRVLSASWNESNARWYIETNTGQRFSSRYFVPALGPLSAKAVPEFGGESSFAGLIVHTGEYPKDLDLRGKRVGVIGTGSTGTQVVAEIADIVSELTVFQRRPQFCVPAGDRDVTADERQAIVDNFDETFETLRASGTAFGWKDSTISASEVTDEERERIFEEVWNIGGGFRFMFGTFNDISYDEQANSWARDFISRKIRETVKDPKTAAMLITDEFYARRPICENGYYSAFNRDNVQLVSIKYNPIASFFEKGLILTDGERFELDVVILATGYDAVDGNYNMINITGTKGRTLREAWRNGAASYMGLAVAGFPNMITIFGPHSAFANNPPLIESQVDFAIDLIRHVDALDASSVDVDPVAQSAWVNRCLEIAAGSLFSKVDSWIFGKNIEGKVVQTYFYFAGLGEYRNDLQGERDTSFQSFRIQPWIERQDLLARERDLQSVGDGPGRRDGGGE